MNFLGVLKNTFVFFHTRTSASYVQEHLALSIKMDGSSCNSVVRRKTRENAWRIRPEKLMNTRQMKLSIPVLVEASNGTNLFDQLDCSGPTVTQGFCWMSTVKHLPSTVRVENREKMD